MMRELPGYAEALSSALQAISAQHEYEPIDLANAAGRVLAKPVIADRDLPPFNRAQMDGYALRSAEFRADRAFPVHATVSAGSSGEVDVPRGSCVAIATGAPVPPQLDTVIQHERSDRGDPVRFDLDAIEAGKAVHPRGADARHGDTLIDVGTLLAPPHQGIAASVGRTCLTVHRRPRIWILTSGDEVVPPTSQPLTHQIRNSNQPMLQSLVKRFGGEVIGSAHVPDTLEETVQRIGDALQQADVVVTVGGVSAGQRDHFPTALEEHGVRKRIHGVAIQPGKPVLVGQDDGGTLVVGLPGNPVSVLATACLFLWPAIRVLGGLPATLPWRTVTLVDPVSANPKRQAFRPACLIEQDQARVPKWAGSGDLCHTASTDGLLELPQQSEPVEAGRRLRFLRWPG